MKVAVFGGTGFVGKYILNALKKKQYDVYTLVRFGSEPKISHIQNINIVSGNIDSPTSVEQTLMNCSAVIYNIGIIREFKSKGCLLYTSPSPRDGLLSRMPSSA